MFRLLCGDCIEVMKTLPENSVDAIVTDPPYGLRFMGKDWDTFRMNKRGQNQLINMGNGMKPLDHVELLEFQEWNTLWATEAIRILKPGGHLLSFGGTRTYHRMACAIEDAGFEIRDQIQWIYGSGFPKSMNIGNGWGTALKPANEPIVLARKPISEKTIVQNVLRWGTGGLNIDACRVGEEGHIVHGKESGKFQPTGGETIKDYHNVFGRFPANVIHDGSDEVVAMFPDNKGAFAPVKSGQKGFGGVIYGKYNQAGDDGATFYGDGLGSAARFFYCAKASRSERNAGLEERNAGLEERTGHNAYGDYKGTPEHGTNMTNSQRQNHHPTVKPIALMRYLCKLITPINGTVLDPFMGSGTTGIAAELEGFDFIGIEMNQEYIEIAEKRIHYAQQQLRIEFPVEKESTNGR